MTQITDAAKKVARKAAFAARKLAHGAGHDPAANAVLTDYLTHHRAKTIAAYMAIRTEIDPLPSMIALHALGRQICVPVIKGEGQPLAFHLWHPDDKMIDGPFGAKIPAQAMPVTPDIVIAPLVAFDANFTRLGYGGGFYDRSLCQMRAHRPVQMLGFAYAEQETQALPRGPYDIPLDAIFTQNSPRWAEMT